MDNNVCANPSSQREINESLQAIARYQVKGMGRKKCIERYDKTGAEYEAHASVINYQGPYELARTMEELFPENRDQTKILDAASGTGLAGVELFKAGFTHLDAVDASEGMLALAKTKNIYQRLICEYLGENKLEIKDRIYDAVTMCGGIGENHVPYSAFEELLSVIKPGGVFVNVTRAEHSEKVDEYRDKALPLFEKLAEEGKWKLEMKRKFPDFIAGVEGVLSVYRVL
ncbi:demethylmenaquinone methyltransferase-like [Gigantopelta aegis]|uniref:demethylmenaquinone methyltransferase-like n=1 Tax=Gigantopelta aegis TaxID=1735272 RepID=UPI001B88B7C8|nr:demethylmenaquinone methyltransferase-like [Gigantopelta aegis]